MSSLLYIVDIKDVKKSEKSSVISHRLGLHLRLTIIVVVRTTNTTTMLLPLGPSTPVLEPVVERFAQRSGRVG
uniref:Uncharacterized protein n=1 Tax=Brassica oleracea var. oleracea TaxID=109376 RepID=A0A0D3A9C3_BRAOL